MDLEQTDEKMEVESKIDTDNAYASPSSMWRWYFIYTHITSVRKRIRIANNKAVTNSLLKIVQSF